MWFVTYYSINFIREVGKNGTETIRMVGSNMSPSGIALEEGVVAICTKNLDKIVKVDKDAMTVTIQVGVTIGKKINQESLTFTIRTQEDQLNQMEAITDNFLI